MITLRTKKTIWTMETMRITNFYAQMVPKINICEGLRPSVQKIHRLKPLKITKKSIALGLKMTFTGLKETLLNKMYSFFYSFSD
jgi:hypothetical protein